jgi:hypothetical protein
MAIMLLLVSVPAVAQKDKFVEDPAATNLFRDARAARATWDGFPGFTANLIVNHNGKITKAKVEVKDTGKVVLDIADADIKKFVYGQVASLVGHRMGGDTGKDTPCAFADKDTVHPLGRKIIVLGDEMGSSYRIKDNQLLEVNRKLKVGHFTITVLKNHLTPEKKYLPLSYVVNTWGAKGLQSSWTYQHTWKRVGKYDLPAGVMIVIAVGGLPDSAEPAPPAPTLDVWSLTFTDQELLPWKS